ncbi:MAG: hypothetical protein M1827_006092 [Pycnora praestabilis]|nr:MAG: hypothetical protein M1827_006092 [Pycnora praestabilis]
MPPNRSSTTKRKPSTFKPPRPASKPSQAAELAPRQQSNISPTSKADSTRREPRAIDMEGDAEEPQYMIAEVMEDPVPTIPPKLLTKLLHTHFEDDRTRINKEANKVVAKYVETFVREALARAAFEGSGSAASHGRGARNDFLEVEDLEKLAPQLLLDF